MTKEEIKEIEKVYSEVHKGAAKPKVIVYSCPDCRRHYVFPGDEPCQHLKDKLNEQSKQEEVLREIRSKQTAAQV